MKTCDTRIFPCFLQIFTLHRRHSHRCAYSLWPLEVETAWLLPSLCGQAGANLAAVVENLDKVDYVVFFM